MNAIPQANPYLENQKLEEEIVSAVSRVVKSGTYILGEEVHAFEREFASYLNVSYAIGVGSGTDAIFLSLVACGIGPGHEVILPSHTAVATAAAVVMTGAIPIFADIEKDFFTLDPNSVELLISPRTKAVIVVHLYGQPAQVEEILQICDRHNLYLIEDCAQAVGSQFNGRKVGTIGHAGCFSFYPTKNLGTIGDGGCVVSNNLDLTYRLRKLRQYGWGSNRADSTIHGFNSRLDEVHAAILRVKLEHLDDFNNWRGFLAKIYSNSFTNTLVSEPKVRPGCYHSFHLYVVRCRERHLLEKHLSSHDIGFGFHYLTPVHQQTAFKNNVTTAELKVTEEISKDILSLPIYPYLSPDNVERVAEVVNDFYDA